MLNKSPLLEQIVQSPLLIDANAQQFLLSTIQHITNHKQAEELLSAQGDAQAGDSYWPLPDDWRAAYRPYTVINGVLQIPVMGVLLNRFPWQLGRWATGYTYLEKAFARGLDDPEVRGIAFLCDTPGGEVSGNFEFVDKVYESRGQKPVRAFAADRAYSAGYSIASAADDIIITRSGGVGSIGVLTAHVEYSDMMEKSGVKVTFIFAGKHKVDGNIYEKLPEAVRARFQERIDRLYGVFTSTVARNRAMEENDVRATEALTYDATDAIDARLADRVGSLEEEMVIFCDEVALGDEQMATPTNKNTAQTEDAVAKDVHDAAVADAQATGEASGRKAERARLTAILGSDEGKARPKAAMSLALKSDVDADTAKALLSDMPEEKAIAPVSAEEDDADDEKDNKNKKDQKKDGDKASRNHFEEHMRQNNPEITAGGDDDDDSASEQATSNSILADYAGAAGKVRK